MNTGNIPKEVGSWYVEGIGEDFIPGIADFSMIKKGYSIADRESFSTARDLLVKEGIFAGSSSGTLLASALKYCKEQKQNKQVLTFICDSGNKYLTKMYNDLWMKDHGLLQRQKYGDLRDIVFRSFENREIISIKPKESLRKAYLKMKENSISQLPVIENNKVIGVIDESDLLISVSASIDHFDTPVEEIMNKNVVSISYDASEDELLDILKKDYVAIVETKDHVFFGLITKIDYLTYLQLKYI